MAEYDPNAPLHADAGAPDAPADPQDAWDEERRRCPVAHDASGAWTVHGHAETLSVLHDHETFSNRVSTHVSVPNGMDPPEHGPFRTIVDRYFGPEAMAAFEPVCRTIARDLVAGLAAAGGGDGIADLGEPFAVRVQCAFMGWPDAMQDTLAEWQDANQRATRSGDRSATAAVARSFERSVTAILDERRARGDAPPADPTGRLLLETVEGRPLTDQELLSIVRNWTVGELGTIAASIGILLHALGRDPDLQERLRRDPSRLPPAIDEILRVRGPLIANRRVATRDTELGGRRIAAGDRLRILWPSANRDARAFEDAERIRPDRDPSANLLYGAGIHVCPGAPLARLELRVVMEELLARTDSLTLDEEEPPVFAEPPKGGFERITVHLS